MGGMIMTLRRREFLRLATGMAALPAISGVARAALYPDHPIRLLLPFPPGGVFDIVGRPWADKVRRTLGTVIVETMPGAGGSVAMTATAHAAPDGYTIFLGSTAIHMADMILRTHPLIYPMKELQPISMLGISTFAIVVHPSVPAKTLKELVDYVKANP